MFKRKKYFITIIVIISIVILLQIIFNFSFLFKSKIKSLENSIFSYPNSIYNPLQKVPKDSPSSVSLTFSKNYLLSTGKFKHPYSISSLSKDFNDIFAAPFILEPPLLTSDSQLYIASHTISLSKQQIQFTILKNTRQHFGTYFEIFEQQNQKLLSNLQTKYSPNYEAAKKYICGMMINNQLFLSSPIIKFNELSGNLICKFDNATTNLLLQTQEIQFLLFSKLNEQQIDQILCKVRMKNSRFQINVANSIFPMKNAFPIQYNPKNSQFEYKNPDTRPFYLCHAVAPLVWNQIQKPVFIQWLEFHRMMGVSHFLIYIKEEEFKQEIHEKLLYYIENHIITLINWNFGVLKEPINAFQVAAGVDANARLIDFCTWFILSDTDEYFAPIQKDNLVDLLQPHEVRIRNTPQESRFYHFRVRNHFFGGKSQTINQGSSSNILLEQHVHDCHASPMWQRTKMISYTGYDKLDLLEDVHWYYYASEEMKSPEMDMIHYFAAYDERRQPPCNNPPPINTFYKEKYGQKLRQRMVQN